MTTRVTLKDLARQTGLSIKHVSRALHEDPGVSRETRRRVQQLARRLGYAPNLSARNLVLNRTHTIGILVPDLAVPFFAEFTLALQHDLQERGYFTLIADTHYDPRLGDDRVRRFAAQGIDGLVSIGALSAPARRLMGVRGIPVVYAAFSLQEADGQINHVAYNDAIGGQLAARHLLELGHRRLACFTPHGDPRRPPLRLAAFREAVAHQKGARFLLADQARQVTAEDGYETSARLVERIGRGELDAVFCICDALAIGLLARLSEAGLSVPRDVSVMGYDDLQIARFLNPPLTTIAQPAASLAPPVAERLAALIAQPDSLTHHLLLTPRLVARRSTAPRA